MLDVADTAANDEFFGRPGTRKGERSAFPQVRVVALAECGTHAIFDAELGTYAQSEMALSKVLVDRLEAGMILLADRGFCSFDLWRQAIATGADLLWRAKNNTKPRRIETLDDGSWLAELRTEQLQVGHRTRRGPRRRLRRRRRPQRRGVDRSDCSPLCSTPTKCRRPNSLARTPSDGRSSPRSTNSRPTSAARGRCCVPSRPPSSNKRSGATCAATTRSAR